MRCLRPLTLTTILAGLALLACDDKPQDGAVSTTASGKRAAAPGGALAKMVGVTWVQEREFGDSAAKPLDKRAKLQIKGDGTLRVTYPPTASQPDKEKSTNYKYEVVESRGNSVLMKTMVQLGTDWTASDDKKFTLVDADTLEEKGISDGKESGLGGIYKRFDPNAKPPPPPVAEPPKPEPVAPKPAPPATVCEKAAKCCIVVIGTSLNCDSLVHSPEPTCKRLLAAYRKVVKHTNPAKLKDCD
jgi:hypothetical protein